MYTTSSIIGLASTVKLGDMYLVLVLFSTILSASIVSDNHELLRILQQVHTDRARGISFCNLQQSRLTGSVLIYSLNVLDVDVDVDVDVDADPGAWAIISIY